MAQNIYDTDEFFRGYSQLPRSIHGLDGAPEWPAIRALLPDLGGKRIVDLGCGFGWFARWARQQGAAHVLGLDLSHNMIGRARADTPEGMIEYRIADLEALDLPEKSFDLAYSSLAFHYVRDFGKLTRTIHRALVARGHLVFNIEHPIYMAAAQPQWTRRCRRTQELAGQRLFQRGIADHRLAGQGRGQISPHDRDDAEYIARYRLRDPPRRGICANGRADRSGAATCRGIGAADDVDRRGPALD